MSSTNRDSHRSAPFFCPTCVVNHQSCEIAALHDAVKALTMQLSELQLQCTDKWSSTMQQQPWSKVVRSGNKGNKGKGKGGVSSAGEMSGKVESKPAESKSAGKMGKGVNVSRASDSLSHTVSEDRDKIRVVGARRIWGTLKNSTAASIKSVISRLCKVSEIRVRRKDKGDTVSKRSKWWYVVHGDESVLVRLESNWEQINLQTSWKLEPCFMTVRNNAGHDSSNPGYANTPTGNDNHDGPSVPKSPTSAPTVNLQTPHSVKIADLDGTLDKCNQESASRSDHITDEHFLSMELSNQPPTT